MGYLSFWGARKTDVVLQAIPRPFEMQMLFSEFVEEKLVNLYIAILQECYRHSTGLDDKQARSLWDNFSGIYSNATRGVVRLLAGAMSNRTTLFLVYDRDTGVARRATAVEQSEIMRDYAAKSRSDKGVACNFNKFSTSLLLRVYLGLLYGTLEAANTQVGLSKALELKIKDMRSTQANNSHDEFVQQAKGIVEGLKSGQSILLDKEDIIELPKVDIKPVAEAKQFYSQLMAGELRVSTSFVDGVITSGMNSTGEADFEANEAGIENFFNSIFKPICDELFKVDLKFNSQNYRRIAELVKVLPYVENTEMLSDEQKESFVRGVLGE